MLIAALVVLDILQDQIRESIIRVLAQLRAVVVLTASDSVGRDVLGLHFGGTVAFGLAWSRLIVFNTLTFSLEFLASIPCQNIVWSHSIDGHIKAIEFSIWNLLMLCK